MRYRLSENQGDRSPATLCFGICEAGIGILVFHIHIKSGVLKSPAYPPVINR